MEIYLLKANGYFYGETLFDCGDLECSGSEVKVEWNNASFVVVHVAIRCDGDYCAM